MSWVCVCLRICACASFYCASAKRVNWYEWNLIWLANDNGHWLYLVFYLFNWIEINVQCVQFNRFVRFFFAFAAAAKFVSFTSVYKKKKTQLFWLQQQIMASNMFSVKLIVQMLCMKLLDFTKRQEETLRCITRNR